MPTDNEADALTTTPSRRFRGLSQIKCTNITYEFSVQSKVKTSSNCRKNRKIGKLGITFGVVLFCEENEPLRNTSYESRILKFG